MNPRPSVNLEANSDKARQQRIARTFELIEEHHQKIRAELKASFPEASAEELRQRYIALILPREDVIAAYKFDPAALGYELFTSE